MRLQIRDRVFAPSVMMSVIALAAFVLFCALGNWQLQRASLKRDIQQRYQTQLDSVYDYVSLDAELNPMLQYKKVELSGKFDPGYNWLLDNRLYQKQAGYHVLTPFFIRRDQAVLVNRGWVAVGDDRNRLPEIVPPPNLRHVRGIVTIPSRNGFRMGDISNDGSWPRRIPFIDLEKISQGVDFELLPYVIWEAEESEDIYLREWKPIWSPPEKSEAYALQWFSFAAITLLLFVMLNLKKIKPGETND